MRDAARPPQRDLVLRLVDQLVGADPGHHGAKLCAGLLDWMRGGGLAARLQLGLSGLVVEHEVLHEAARLDISQHALHLGLGLVGYDARAGLDVAVFGGVRDRIPHIGNAAFIEQVDDQLGFVKAFEIGHFGRVSSLDQRFEPGLDEVGDATAQHRLFAEQIGFALFLEVGFDDAGTAAADGAIAAATPAEVAANADVVLIAVGFDAEVEMALFRNDGIMEGIGEGAIIAICRISLRFFSPPEKPTLTGRFSISASIFRSLALARTAFRKSVALISSSPRALRWAFTAVRRKVMLPTPGISTGY